MRARRSMQTSEKVEPKVAQSCPWNCFPNYLKIQKQMLFNKPAWDASLGNQTKPIEQTHMNVLENGNRFSGTEASWILAWRKPHNEFQKLITEACHFWKHIHDSNKRLYYVYVAQLCTVYGSMCKWKLPLQVAAIQAIVRVHLGFRMPLHSTGRQAQRINQYRKNVVPGIKSHVIEWCVVCSFCWHMCLQSEWRATSGSRLQGLEKLSMNTHQCLCKKTISEHEAIPRLVPNKNCLALKIHQLIVLLGLRQLPVWYTCAFSNSTTKNMQSAALFVKMGKWLSHFPQPRFQAVGLARWGVKLKTNEETLWLLKFQRLRHLSLSGHLSTVGTHLYFKT